MENRQKKRTQTFSCPQPDYIRERNYKRVGEWTGDGYEKAERMAHENPAKFNRLLGWADAEAEAQPIQMEVAQAKAKAKKDHKDKAQSSINGRSRPQSRLTPTSPGYDPADDAGSAFVNAGTHS